MSFDCFQKLIVKGTHSSNRLYWDAEASAKVPRKGRERLLVICFPFTGYLMAFTASAYPFPHLVLKQFSVSLTSRKGVSEQIFGEKKKESTLLYSLHQLTGRFIWSHQLKISAQTVSEICTCMCIHSMTVTKMFLKARQSHL